MIGEALAEAWSLFTRNSGRLLAAAAAIFGLLGVVDAVARSTVSETWRFPINVFIAVLGVFWLQAYLAAFVDHHRYRRSHVTLADLLRAVQPQLGVFIPAGLLAAVGVSAGVLLLWGVPGLFLLTFWCLLMPAVVLERLGVGAGFRRSMGLVSQNVVRVLVLVILTGVLATVIGVVLTTLLQPLPRVFDIYLASVVVNVFTAPFIALAWTVAYFELRDADERRQKALGSIRPTRRA